MNSACDNNIPTLTTGTDTDIASSYKQRLYLIRYEFFIKCLSEQFYLLEIILAHREDINRIFIGIDNVLAHNLKLINLISVKSAEECGFLDSIKAFVFTRLCNPCPLFIFLNVVNYPDKHGKCQCQSKVSVLTLAKVLANPCNILLISSASFPKKVYLSFGKYSKSLASNK